MKYLEKKYCSILKDKKNELLSLEKEFLKL